MDPKTRYEKERLDGKQQRLSLILEAAERVFNQKGIENTTMQDIATDANIGIATLFRYFPKKEKLIVAVATRLLEPMLERFEYVAGLPVPCLDKLEALFDFFIEDHYKLSTTFMVDFESYAAHFPEPLEDIHHFNALTRRISQVYSRIIQNGIEDGSVRSDLEVRDTLTTLINTFGIFSKKLSLQKNIPMLEADLTTELQLDILKRVFLDYLKPVF